MDLQRRERIGFERSQWLGQGQQGELIARALGASAFGVFALLGALLLAPAAEANVGWRQDEGVAALSATEVDAAERATDFEAVLAKGAELDVPSLSEEERQKYLAELKECYCNAFWDFTTVKTRRGVDRLFPDTIRLARETWLRFGGDLTPLAKEEDYQTGRLFAQARFSDLLIILEQTAPYLLEEGNPYIARQQLDLAQVHRLQGSWDLSQVALDRVRAHLNQYPDRQGSRFSLISMRASGDQALLHCQRGDWDKARASLEELWTQGELDPDPIGLAIGYKTEIQLHSRLQKFQEALETWQRAQADERLTEFWTGQDGQGYWADLSASGALALAHKARFGSDLAVKELALAEIDETLLHPSLPVQRATSLRARAGELLIQLERFDEARRRFEVLEREGDGQNRTYEQREAIATARAKLVLDGGGDPSELEPAQEGVELAWQGVLEAWGAQDIRDEGLAALWGVDRRELLALWMELQLELHGEEAGSILALEGFLELQSLGTLARSLGCGRPSLEQVRTALLKPGHGIMILVPGLSRVVVLLADSERIVAKVEKVGEPAFRSRIATLNEAIKIGRLRLPNAEALHQARKDLAEIVFPPSVHEQLSSWTSVSLVGTGALDPFPYAYLPGLSDQPIGCELALTLLPSIPVGVWMTNQTLPSHAAEPSLSVVACPAPGAEYAGIQDLPLNAPQRSLLLPKDLNIAQRSWLGGDVSRDGLIATDFSRDRLLHLLLHGISDADQASRAAFALPAGQQLTLPDLEGMRLPPIVLVSACGANRAPLRKGDDGRNNLIGALQLAGSQAALAAHVEVDYMASLRLTERLLKHAATGVSCAEALRRSRQELVADLEAGTHPSEYFLADLYGAPHTFLVTLEEAKNAAPSQPWIWLVGAALVLAMAALGLRLKRS